MRPFLAKIAATVFLFSAITGTAEARRTVIDRSDPDNPTAMELNGYCDLDALDCSPVALGYSVDFGQGPLNQVIVYGNALLSFGTDKVPLDDVSSLAQYGGTVVSPGLNNDLGFDDFGNDAYSLFGSVTVDSLTGVITALFQDCYTPQTCFISNSSLILTPTEGGFQVLAVNPRSALSGYALPDGTVNEQISRSRSFFIPAKFSGLSLQNGVPEPDTWAMMLMGFAAMGFAMRRRSAPRLSRTSS